MTYQDSRLNALRRSLILGFIAFGGASFSNVINARTNDVQVWKDPNCGCCKDWISHLEKNGFQVTVLDQGNNAARARLGLPQKFASCHTALVEGYVIEGHVPAADIQRLPRESLQIPMRRFIPNSGALLRWTSCRYLRISAAKSALHGIPILDKT
ncbi:MAG: DUF411 domain-containing protein [Alphaproteobacteria bacterium]|nr:DUF411 domain-containing protein [Alphaproteobacteria bacterium]